MIGRRIFDSDPELSGSIKNQVTTALAQWGPELTQSQHTFLCTWETDHALAAAHASGLNQIDLLLPTQSFPDFLARLVQPVFLVGKLGLNPAQYRIGGFNGGQVLIRQIQNRFDGLFGLLF